MSNLLRRLRGEPLFVFLLVAAGLFLVQRSFHPAAGGDADSRVIHLDRDALLRFAQFRSRVFDEAAIGARFDAMSVAQKKQLLESLIREEALHREALAWGLDKDDYVIRRRLVQSLEFAVGGGDASGAVPDDAAVRRYFDAHRDAYAEPPSVTFTHVFFSPASGGLATASARAVAALQALNAGRADAATTGDRFLYHLNYSQQSRETIDSHFGAAMGARLFELEPSERWQGPVESEHGVHLVQLRQRSSGGVPAWETIRGVVARDAAQAAARARQEAALDRIVSGYRVELSPELESLR